MPHISDATFTSRAKVHVRSIAQAATDAGRAWAIAPTRHFYRDEKVRRPFTFRERLSIKYKSAKTVFRYSRWTSNAPAVVIQRKGREGLLANVLHVIEVLHRLRPDANVHVDWKLDGSEWGFRYGAVGSDVWAGLFRPIGTSSPPGAFRSSQGIDLALWGSGKDHLSGKALQDQRNAYHRTIAKWIEVTNPNVLSRTHKMHADMIKGRFCLGVHRRVGNIGVSELQKDGKVPTLDALLARCDRLLHLSGSADAAIFLATDDADAVDAFQGAFGPRLIVQDVKRTTASKREVHFGNWGTLSLADAEDVLVDTLLLSRCNALVHASSSVSTMASLLNPNLTLIRLYEAGAD